MIQPVFMTIVDIFLKHLLMDSVNATTVCQKYSLVKELYIIYFANYILYICMYMYSSGTYV